MIKIGQTNINSITNKNDLLVRAVVGNLDILYILLITETKIDSSFQKLSLKLMVSPLPTELIEADMEEVYF